MLTKETIEKNVNDACTELYAEQKALIDEEANERDIVSFLAPKLRVKFPGWDIDTDYNREGEYREHERRDTKTDLNKNPLLPDIIVHKRGPDGPNLVAVEVKGYWNKEKRSEDEDSLRRLRAKHGYEFLYRLELGRDLHELIFVE